MLSFLCGALGGACVTGTLVVTIGTIASMSPLVVRLAAAAVVCVWVIDRYYQGERIGWLSTARLIPQSRFGLPPVVAFAAFGFELGLGFRTRIPHFSPVLLVVVLLLVFPRWPQVAATAVGWAVGRTVPMARAAFARPTTPLEPVSSRLPAV